jgi:uncharacterized membrane protein
MILNFLIYGVIGWCMEVLWTGFNSLLKRDVRLTSTTSIWMFFVYGLAAFMPPIIGAVSILPIIVRGIIYALLIFAAEYVIGIAMKRLRICPWDYSGSKFSIQGVIRLDYAPLWFIAGLLFEFAYLKYLIQLA